MKAGTNRIQGRLNNYSDFNEDGSIVTASGESAILVNTNNPVIPTTFSSPTQTIIPDLTKNQVPLESVPTIEPLPPTSSIKQQLIKPIKQITSSINLEEQFLSLPDEEENFTGFYGDIVGIVNSTIIEPIGKLEGASSISASSTSLVGWYSTYLDNNPFNMIHTKIRWKGKVGFKTARETGMVFEVFDDLNNGVRAGLLNLSGYFTVKKLKTIRQIINTYAPPGSLGQSAEATAEYIKFVTNYMKQNLNSKITPDTQFSFAGFKETNETNIKIFKTLVKAILKQEGKLTTFLNNSIDNFNVINLK